MWITIAKDPLDRYLIKAISLGPEHGNAYAGYAVEVPDNFFELYPDAEKYFDIVDEDNVTDLDKRAMAHNRARDESFKAAAKEAQKKRKSQRKKKEIEAAVAAVAEMSDDFPDSDDD